MANSSHAFLYSDGQMQRLGTLGGNDGIGSAMNNSGQVAGSSAISDGAQHAFIYTNGQITDLGTLGGRESFASGINNSGQVVGGSRTDIAIVDHAFLYSDGRIIDLGTLSRPSSSGSLASSSARDINDSGLIVGSSQLFFRGSPRAFVYMDGRMIDLNDLIDPALGVTLSTAVAINDQGQILANGVRGANNFENAYLLAPAANFVPEPHRLTILGLGLFGVFSLRMGLREGLGSNFSCKI